jgi:hypothetical protein
MKRTQILEALKKAREDNGITGELPKEIVVPMHNRPHKHDWRDVPSIAEDPSRSTREAQGIMNES